MGCNYPFQPKGYWSSQNTNSPCPKKYLGCGLSRLISLQPAALLMLALTVGLAVYKTRERLLQKTKGKPTA